MVRLAGDAAFGKQAGHQTLTGVWNAHEQAHLTRLRISLRIHARDAAFEGAARVARDREAHRRANADHREFRRRHRRFQAHRGRIHNRKHRRAGVHDVTSVHVALRDNAVIRREHVGRIAILLGLRQACTRVVEHRTRAKINAARVLEYRLADGARGVQTLRALQLARAQVHSRLRRCDSRARTEVGILNAAVINLGE